MKWLFIKQNLHPRVAEGGAILALAAIILVLALISCGLVVDVGRVFIAQNKLQRALDAGVTTAVYLLNRRSVESVEEAARVQILNHVSESNLDATLTNLRITATAFNIQAEGTAEVNLYIMSILPLVGNTTKIQGVAQAERPALRIALVLDYSGSMNSPIMNPPIDHLKAATLNFINLLDEERDDRIALITYNSPTTTVLHWGLDQPVNKTALTNIIENSIAQGQTCISCGLKLAREQFFSIPDPDPKGSIQYVILMTDGVPNNMYYEPGTFNPPFTCGYGNETLGASAIYIHGVSIPDAEGGNVTAPFRRGAYHQALAEAKFIKTARIPIYSIGLGTSPQYGTPMRMQSCTIGSLSPQYYNHQDIYCCLPEIRTAFGFSQLNPSDVVDEYYTWRSCGGDLNPMLLSEISNDPDHYDPILRFDPPDGVSLPSEQDCIDDLTTLHCSCLPEIGENSTQGVYIETDNPAELTPIFESFFLQALYKTRLIR